MRDIELSADARIQPLALLELAASLYEVSSFHQSAPFVEERLCQRPTLGARLRVSRRAQAARDHEKRQAHAFEPTTLLRFHTRDSLGLY
jgi:hypothetical protein